MEIVYEHGEDELAKVYVGRFRGSEDYLLEFVDSLSGSSGREEKWVVVLSSQFGCPVGCKMCDAADYYHGNATTKELLAQVDYLINKRFPSGQVKSKKFKVQFARMGEPAYNPNVLEAIRILEERYPEIGYMPCVSTIAPKWQLGWFEELLEMNRYMFKGRFQLQFSVHSTDERVRNELMPVNKWTLQEIAEYGDQFYVGGRKISLNFAVAPESVIEPDVLRDIYDPEKFLIKVTPVNPTSNARKNGLVNVFDEKTGESNDLVQSLRKRGFQVIVSIGDLRENDIGSNCGQLVALWKEKRSIDKVRTEICSEVVE